MELIGKSQEQIAICRLTCLSCKEAGRVMLQSGCAAQPAAGCRMQPSAEWQAPTLGTHIDVVPPDKGNQGPLDAVAA